MSDTDRDAVRRRLEYLAHAYSLSRISWRRRRGPFDDHDVHYAIDRLRSANEVLEFLNATSRDPYRTLTDLNSLLGDIQSGLETTRSVANQTRFLELLDDHIDTLMKSLDPADLPEVEEAMLRALGFPDLAATIRERVELLGTEWRNGTSPGQPVAKELRKAPASQALNTAIDSVVRHRDERANFSKEHGDEQTGTEPIREDESPKRERRWWKGIGQVVQGAAIATADVGLFVGVLHFPVSPETRTYGALVSVAGGFGTIMNGVGDLWGE